MVEIRENSVQNKTHSFLDEKQLQNWFKLVYIKDFEAENGLIRIRNSICGCGCGLIRNTD